MNLVTAKEVLKKYGFDVEDDEELRAERLKIVAAMDVLNRRDYRVTKRGRAPITPQDIDAAISAVRAEELKKEEESNQ